jgi:hypothetical protein
MRKNRQNTFEALEPRQHMAIDLVIADFEFDQQTNPMRPRADGHLTGRVIVQNGGTTTSRTSWMSIYLEDNPHSTSESRQQLYTFPVPVLAFGRTSTVNFDIVMPEMPSYDLDDNDLYLAAYADSANQNTESNESNNSYRAEGADYIRFRGEDNLTILPGAGGRNSVAPYLKAQFFPWPGKIGDEIAGGYDIDTFDVDLDRAQQLEIGIDQATFNAAIRVYDPGWNLIASNDQHDGDPNPNDPYVHIVTGGGGRFHVVVSSAQNFNADPFTMNGRVEGETGTYRLYESVWTQPTVTIGPETFGTIYEHSGDALGRGGFWLNRTGPTDRRLVVQCELSGTATPGGDVFVISGGMIPPGQSRGWVPFSVRDDDVIESPEYLSFSIKPNSAEYFIGSPNTYTVVVRENPQIVGPRATNSAFVFDDLSGPRVYVQFDDLIQGYDANDLVIQNLTTGQTITNKRAVASPNGDTAILFFDGGLTDGDYRATFKAGGITNSAGGANNADYNFTFFSLRGDANHDRKVDFGDLVPLSQNYGKLTGMTYHNGDFTYDGKVNFDDLIVLSQQYGKQLPAPIVAPLSIGSDRGEKRMRAVDKVIA